MKLIFTMFLLVILVSDILAQGKGGRWQFENNGFDTAVWDSLEDNGVLIDTASFSQDVPLQEGEWYLWLDTAYTYNFLKIEDSDDLDFTDENIGISAWIYPVESGITQFFVSKGIQNTNPKTTNYALRISNSQNLQFLIRDAGNQARTVGSSFTIPLNQWTFVAVYYDFSAHIVYMWNDPLSDAVDSLDFNQSFFANNGPLAIGSWFVDIEETPSTANFKGRIDDVRISSEIGDIIPQVTALNDFKMNTVTNFQLKQNYPNPFNPTTKISFYLAQPEYVSLKIYDNQGKHIKTLLEKSFPQGNHHVDWDGENHASGIYYYQLKSVGFTQTKKMLYIK